MTSWHLDPEVVDAYLDATLDDARAASLEAHVVTCSTCRLLLADRSDADELDALWHDLVDRLDAEPSSRTTRLLLRLGLRDDTARLLGSAPLMSSPWAAAVVLVMAAAWVLHAAVEANATNVVLFLYVAPLLPMLGVTAAYGPLVDDSHEVTVATPYPTYRLALLRTAGAAAIVTLAGFVAALTLPGPWLDAVRWLLPALALSAVAFALLGRLPPVPVALMLAVAWMVFAGALAWWMGDRAAPFEPAVQLVYLALAAVAGVVTARSPDRFDVLGRSS
jgi:hypothetical protein